jgi:tetratricopeptide (TPR) repeat protein
MPSPRSHSPARAGGAATSFGWGIAAALLAATAVVYAPVLGFEFVEWDDQKFVTENPRVHGGLTWEGLVWAVTQGNPPDWHPLTFLSHMLDCQVFGLEPGGHHATNLFLHALNTLLVFGLFRHMTGAVWPSALVAALFGVHPLHVEAVAWVSQRKELLSATFALLATRAYVGYATRGGVARYVTTAVLLALALLSKAMAVTLPFVFLLLDYWPLGRTGSSRRGASGEGRVGRQRPLPGLVLEKVPLLLLSAAMSAITYVVQRAGGAVVPAEAVAFPLRVANALVAYARYVGKALWPASLGAQYTNPYLPGGTPLASWQIGAAAVLLLAATAAAVLPVRRRWHLGYIPVGWLWFLGTLVPVIGLVQVGTAAMADRYTYMPLTGLFLIVAWGGRDIVRRWPGGARVVAAAAVAGMLGASMAVSASQVRYWRDSESLFSRALAVSPGDPKMHYNLGTILLRQERHEEAIAHLLRAARLRPRDPAVFYNLALAHRAVGKIDAAAKLYEAAMRLDPADPDAPYMLAGLRRQQDRPLDAIALYERVIEIAPRDVGAHYDLGNLLLALGRPAEAIARYRDARALEPGSAEVRTNLGVALRQTGRLEEARAELEEALRIAPDDADAAMNLAQMAAEATEWERAAALYGRVVRHHGSDPRYLEAHLGLAAALTALGQTEQARLHREAAARLAGGQ